MAKTRPLLSLGVRLAFAFASSLATAAPVRAADWNYPLVAQDTPTYTADFGLRFWYGRASTAKNLYDHTGTFMVSRLTYGDLSIFAGEAYGRFDLDRGWFVKGYVGGGTFRKGDLKDEDFPPAINPYSATLSVQEDGTPIYASADVGFTVLRGGDFRVGVFGGVHCMTQSVSAFGCTQTSFNPFVCGAFPLPNQVRVISQENNWYSLRVGVDAAVEIDRFKFSVDAALVPYLWLQGYDTHWLRIGTQPGDFTGPIPEDGTGWGYQVDAFLSYRVTETLSVGVGGRYWYMQSRGFTHFEERVVGVNTVPQPVEWKTQNFGVFLQGSIKLGPYALFSSN